MSLLNGVMGMLNVASLIWIVANDTTGFWLIYTGSLLYFIGQFFLSLNPKGTKQ